MKCAVLLDDSLTVGFEILRPMTEGQEVTVLIVIDAAQAERRFRQLRQEIVQDEKRMVSLIDVAADEGR